MAELPLHPDAEPLAFLLGTWRGTGRGEYPTIETFDFEEETRFWHAGASFLYYHLRTWSPSAGSTCTASSASGAPTRAAVST